jgi:undecaprenyl-phosphate 4-deoxy-4-formamido-L-arabinose transferase
MQILIGASHARDISSFRAFRTQLRDGFARFAGPFVSIDVLLTWSTSKFAAVRVRRERRTVGKSNYSFWNLLVATTHVVTAFSTLPLRIASVMGFVMTLFGIGTFLYVIATYILKGSVPGFPFLACLIAMFSGAQLFALGIIGEYLGRMFHRSMERPVYTIKEAIGGSTDRPG